MTLIIDKRAEPGRDGDWRPQYPLAAAATLALLAGGAYLGGAVGLRQAGLYLVGGALGLALYHAAFGFTSAYRRFITEARGEGVRAQLVMLALASAIFAPLLGAGSALGQPLAGAVAPVGLSVAVGSFLFGLGMQLSGGCASGTLYTVGGGSTRMVITLLAFVAGSVLGALQFPWWYAAPSFPPVSLIDDLGWPGALSLHLPLLWGRRGARSLERGDAFARGPALGHHRGVRALGREGA
jgi:uncharacterized membrane protein YedE/YeeE